MIALKAADFNWKLAPPGLMVIIIHQAIPAALGPPWTQLELTDALPKKISADVVSVEIHQQECNISLYFILYFKHSSRLALCGKITNHD